MVNGAGTEYGVTRADCFGGVLLTMARQLVTLLLKYWATWLADMVWRQVLLSIQPTMVMATVDIK